MPGCIGSTDACHVGMLNCHNQLRIRNSGFKMNMPTRTFNLTANHRRKILSTTTGHPGRFNDKTLVRFDKFVMNVKGGKILPKNVFGLLWKNEDGNVVERKHSGVWLVVDNGYHHWSVTIPPYKNPNTYFELRWSKWLESMRKDVECTFGILKGRFRLLKNGIRVRGQENTDKIWLTCCALHNFLLEEDGLDCPWKNSFGIDIWLQPSFANHSNRALRKHLNIENVTEAHRLLDTTFIGVRQGNIGEDDNPEVMYDSNSETAEDNMGGDPDAECIPVRLVPFEVFRQRLVEHFDILFSTQKLKWPSRSGIGVQPAVGAPKKWENV